jgi:hypothetical protein
MQRFLTLTPCRLLPATLAGQDIRYVRLMTAPTPGARNPLMP